MAPVFALEIQRSNLSLHT